MGGNRIAALGVVAVAVLAIGLAWATADTRPAAPPPAAPADDKADKGEKADAGKSNETLKQPKLVQESYPLDDNAARQKTVKLLQQVTVDLLALFNLYKEAHWDMTGPLYLVLHEYYQQQADYYRLQSDVFAERVLHLGYTIDGRYSTVAKTSSLPDFPAGFLTDNQTLHLLIERVTIFQKEVYKGIKETENSDPPTSNKLQELAFAIDKNLWQLRSHIQRPGGLGDDLPWVATQGKTPAAAPANAGGGAKPKTR